MSEFRPCALVPTFDNPGTVRRVVERIHAFLPDVVVVDDGSGEAGRRAVEALERDGLAHTIRREANGGKGAAVKTGLRLAKNLGFSHALQVDADGQHALEDVARFLEAGRKAPTALILGHPLFDGTAPKSRLRARQITRFWVDLETGGGVIADAMCGFRLYPLDAALAAGAKGDRMDFDPEIAVRMAWAGVPVVNLETRVHYVRAEDGGVSHFHLFWDNVRISWMHTRLVSLMIGRLLLGRRPRRSAP
jgi:polyprenyl-phospho-N-acetylgalactosaminyl synthase